jgi:NAD-dependent dihydropyrimidine dehydrogenase PreA subunit
MKHRYLKNVVTLQLNEDKCTGCGMCLNVCPQGVLGAAGKKVQITDRDACMECGACAANCPFNAITVNAGVGCAAAIIKGNFTGQKPSCGCGGSCC